MDRREIVGELEKDLLRAAATGKVLYLEGHTDVTVLFGLLARSPPTSVPAEGLPLDGVWIRGLPASGKGSGSSAVQSRVQVAMEERRAGVRGVVDGDGRDPAALAAEFDRPHIGPLYSWKAYCIENLLVQSGWPSGWGPEPDWHSVLADYLPYSALNRLVRRLQARWYAQGINRSGRPVRGQELRTAAQIREQLRRDPRTLPVEGDLVAAFDAELDACRRVVETSLVHAHTVVDGKWLVEVHAAHAARCSAADCRARWAAHAGGHGGHAEVIEWWRRWLAG